MTMHRIFFGAAMLLSSTAQANEIVTEIHEMCETKWPGDPRMQEFCADTQIEATHGIWLLNQKAAGNPDLLGITGRCIIKWTDSAGQRDFSMIHFCMDEQFKSYDRLQQRRD